MIIILTITEITLLTFTIMCPMRITNFTQKMRRKRMRKKSYLNYDEKL